MASTGAYTLDNVPVTAVAADKIDQTFKSSSIGRCSRTCLVLVLLTDTPRSRSHLRGPWRQDPLLFR